MRGRLGFVLAATAVVGLAYLVPPAWSKKQPACSGGRYVVAGGLASITGAAAGHPEMITLAPPSIAMTGCASTSVRSKARKASTRLVATWRSCGGVHGRVRLRAMIDTDCSHIWGHVKPKGKAAMAFDAPLSVCGDGTVDADAGETCDGGGCPVGQACESCACSTTGPLGNGGCGNGVKEGGEECDGEDFGGASCPPGSVEGAFLECDDETCTIDLSNCTDTSTSTVPPVTTTTVTTTTTSSAPPSSVTTTTTTVTTTPPLCGNGVRDDGEACDCGSNGCDEGDDFGGATCPGSSTGAFLQCINGCTQIDASECPGAGTTTSTTVPPESTTTTTVTTTTTSTASPLCGNGTIDTGEVCDCAIDACDFGGATCPGSTTGAFLVCADGCTRIDESECPGASTTTTTTVPPETTTSSTVPGASTSTTVPVPTSTTSAPTTTTSTTLPSLDHFKCYKTKAGAEFAPRRVTVTDQFGTSGVTAIRPFQFCNPADKNGEGVSDPTAHLMCYDIEDDRPFEQREVLVRNQFGDQRLNVVRPESLCLPAEKSGVASALALNHFKCYRVRGQRGVAAFRPRDVGLTDQFETKTMTVVKPVLLCNPADKNGGGTLPVTGQDHLTCYAIKDASGFSRFVPRDVSVMDQFAEHDFRTTRGTCRKVSFLCVPSLKNPGAPTTSTSSTTLPPTTSTSLAPTTTSSSSTSTVTSSTASTTVEVSTSTSVTSTSTSSVTTPTLCGNGVIDPDLGEICDCGDDGCDEGDPFGGVTCPGSSAAGAFLECVDECQRIDTSFCPGASTTTTTLLETTTTLEPTTTTSSSTTSTSVEESTTTTAPTPTTTTTPSSTTTTSSSSSSTTSLPPPTTSTSTSSTTITTTSTTSSSSSSSSSTSTSTSSTTSTTASLCCGAERITLFSSVGTLAVDNLAPFPFPAGVTTTMEVGAATGGAACEHPVVVPAGGFFVPNFDLPALNYCSSVTPTGCAAGGGLGGGNLWDGNGTPDVAAVNVTKSGDTADGVCDTTTIVQGTCTGGANNGLPCVQAPNCPGGVCTGASGCTTATTGAGGNTRGDIDSVVVAGPGGGVRSLLDIPVHSLTWSDSLCSPAITPGCCPGSNYNPVDGDLVITEFDFILSPTTGTGTGQFVDKNGNVCKRAGSGFSNPTPDGPQSLTGTAAAGPCCVPGQATTVVSVGIGFSGGAPLYDLGFKSTIPNTVSTCGAPGPAATCTVATDTCLQ